MYNQELGTIERHTQLQAPGAQPQVEQEQVEDPQPDMLIVLSGRSVKTFVSVACCLFVLEVKCVRG